MYKNRKTAFLLIKTELDTIIKKPKISSEKKKRKKKKEKQILKNDENRKIQCPPLSQYQFVGSRTSINRLINVRTSNYNLRGVNLLSLPKVNSTKYGLKCFSYYSAKQWNTLPDDIRTLAGTVKDFVSKIRSLTF